MSPNCGTGILTVAQVEVIHWLNSGPNSCGVVQRILTTQSMTTGPRPYCKSTTIKANAPAKQSVIGKPRLARVRTSMPMPKIIAQMATITYKEAANNLPMVLANHYTTSTGVLPSTRRPIRHKYQSPPEG